MSGNPWDPTAPMGPARPAPAAHAGPGAPRWQSPQPVAAPEPITETLPLRQRRWLAALALYLLAPLTAELLTGSTPPLSFLTPISLIFLPALYGSGALLIRETARRRGLGWWSVIVLGAAYGVLEEGLVVTSWFNAAWPDVAFLDGYGRALGVNWYWALGLTAFHAIVSVTLPIVLVEAAFPTLASLPWLRRRGYPLLMIWLGATAIFGLIVDGFIEFHAQGYHPPLLGWLAALLIALALLWLGLHPLARLWRHAHGEQTVPPVVTRRPAPSYPALRFAGFGFTLLYFVFFWGGPQVFKRASIGAAALALMLALSAWIVSRWSHRLDWSPRRRLALLSGVALFFVALGPLVEFVAKPGGKDESGLWVVALAALIALIWLARSARLTEQRRLSRP